jgi:hypothetical protein
MRAKAELELLTILSEVKSDKAREKSLRVVASAMQIRYISRTKKLELVKG